MLRIAMLYVGAGIILATCSTQITADDAGSFLYRGVLAYSTDPKTKETVVLLGLENRMELKFGCAGRKWNGIGGTREHKETPSQTASREFDEETGNAYGRGFLDKNNLLNEKLRLKHPRHESYVYLVKLPYKNIRDFPKIRSEVEQLAWVSAKAVFAAIDTAKRNFPGRFGDNMIKGRCKAELLADQVKDPNRALYPPLVDVLESTNSFAALF